MVESGVAVGAATVFGGFAILAGLFLSPRVFAASLTYPDALARARQASVGPRAAANATALARETRELARYEDDAKLTVSAGLAARWRKLDDKQKLTQDELTKEQSYGLSAGVPLYDFGRLGARERQLDLELRAAEMGEAEAADELTYVVARAYLAAAAALQVEAVIADQERLAETKLKEQTRLYQQGLRPETDVVAARVDVGRARIARQSAADDALAARLRLAVLLGETSGTAGAAATVPPLAARPKALAAWLDGEMKAERRALPADQRRALEKDALTAELDRLAAQKRPTLGATLAAQEVGSFAPLRPQASAALTLAWEIPWNGMHRDEEQANALRRRAIELQGEQDALQREGQLRYAEHLLKAAERSATALAEQWELVARQQKLTQQRYAAGRASALELSTAETGVLAVRLDLARLSAQALEAAIDAAEARGVQDLAPLFAMGGEG